MVALFRAVTQIELDSIRSLSGRFHDSPHQGGEKGFFFSLESALSFARNASFVEGVTHFVVRTEAPDELVEHGRPHAAAGEGAGVYLAVGDLASLSPAVEVSF